jgi:predicted PurR-regulated permease PerM
MSTFMRRWLTGRAARLLSLACIAVAVVMTVVIELQVSHQSGCLSQWADRYTARVNRLTAVNSDHNKTTDAVIQALNTALLDAIRKDQAALTRDVPAYQRAVSEYQAASARLAATQKANPVPDSPRLNC